MYTTKIKLQKSHQPFKKPDILSTVNFGEKKFPNTKSTNKTVDLTSSVQKSETEKTENFEDMSFSILKDHDATRNPPALSSNHKPKTASKPVDILAEISLSEKTNNLGDATFSILKDHDATRNPPKMLSIHKSKSSSQPVGKLAEVQLSEKTENFGNETFSILKDHDATRNPPDLSNVHKSKITCQPVKKLAEIPLSEKTENFGDATFTILKDHDATRNPPDLSNIHKSKIASQPVEKLAEIPLSEKTENFGDSTFSILKDTEKTFAKCENDKENLGSHNGNVSHFSEEKSFKNPVVKSDKKALPNINRKVSNILRHKSSIFSELSDQSSEHDNDKSLNLAKRDKCSENPLETDESLSSTMLKADLGKLKKNSTFRYSMKNIPESPAQNNPNSKKSDPSSPYDSFNPANSMAIRKDTKLSFTRPAKYDSPAQQAARTNKIESGNSIPQ